MTFSATRNLFLFIVISLTGMPPAWSADISRTMFVQFMKTSAPQTLCSSTSLLNCMDINREICLKSLKPINLQCASSQFDQMPESFTETEENVSRYARQYSICLLDTWKAQDSLYGPLISNCFGR